MTKKIYRRIVLFFLLITITSGISYYIYSIRKNIPDTIYIESNTEDTFVFNVPVIGTMECEAVQASVNLLEPFEICTGNITKQEIEIKLFGFIPIKEVDLYVSDTKKAVACGIPVGVYIETDGVLVVDVGEVKVSNGENVSPSKGIIKAGDYIVSINGKIIENKEQLIELINDYGDDYLQVGIRRNNEDIYVKVKPVKDEKNLYKIGTWVKDDCQGLGTLTYVTEDGKFGALGHAISDNKTGQIVEIQSGRIYTAKIWSVVKGKSGTPGEVIGSINYGDSNCLGKINKNNQYGIYGETENAVFAYVDEVYLNVAYKQDIQKGKAYIRTFVSGVTTDYEIEITDIDYSSVKENKGIVFNVTDKQLLKMTNGIVQGMFTSYNGYNTRKTQ